jgi:hypothetical protein
MSVNAMLAGFTALRASKKKKSTVAKAVVPSGGAPRAALVGKQIKRKSKNGGPSVKSILAGFKILRKSKKKKIAVAKTVVPSGGAPTAALVGKNIKRKKQRKSTSKKSKMTQEQKDIKHGNAWFTKSEKAIAKRRANKKPRKPTLKQKLANCLKDKDELAGALLNQSLG